MGKPPIPVPEDRVHRRSDSGGLPGVFDLGGVVALLRGCWAASARSAAPDRNRTHGAVLPSATAAFDYRY